MFWEIAGKRFRSLRLPKKKWVRHVVLISEPFIIATFVTVLWYQCYKRHWYFPHQAEVVLMGVVGFLAVLFAVAAGLIFIESWNRYRKIRLATFLGNRRLFSLNHGDSIPTIMHYALAGLGAPPLILVTFAHFPNAISGGAIVFSLWFGMCLYFIVTLELQDPSRSIWFRAEVPRLWLSGDVREYLRREGLMGSHPSGELSHICEHCNAPLGAAGLAPPNIHGLCPFKFPCEPE
ncbi:MAG: hypothetical protein RIQ56_708 [Candidatus Parcubacteria bacterium]|jgi:hypothetical protein